MQVELTKTDYDILDAADAAIEKKYTADKQEQKYGRQSTISFLVVLLLALESFVFFALHGLPIGDRIVFGFIILVILITIIVNSTDNRVCKNADILWDARKQIVEQNLQFTFYENEPVYLNSSLQRYLVEKNDEMFEVMVAFTDTHIKVLPVKTYQETEIL